MNNETKLFAIGTAILTTVAAAAVGFNHWLGKPKKAEPAPAVPAVASPAPAAK